MHYMCLYIYILLSFFHPYICIYLNVYIFNKEMTVSPPWPGTLKKWMAVTIVTAVMRQSSLLWLRGLFTDGL